MGLASSTQMTARMLRLSEWTHELARRTHASMPYAAVNAALDITEHAPASELNEVCLLVFFSMYLLLWLLC
jgi:hypothetical protein